MLLTPSNGLALPLLSTLTGVTGSTSASPNGFDSATAPKGLDSALVVAGGSGGGGGGAPADASPNGFAAEGGTGGGGTVGVPLFRRPITEAVRSAGAGPSPKGLAAAVVVVVMSSTPNGLAAAGACGGGIALAAAAAAAVRPMAAFLQAHGRGAIDRRLGLWLICMLPTPRPSARLPCSSSTGSHSVQTRRLRHLERDRHRLRRALRADDPPAMAAVMPAVRVGEA